MLIGDNQDRVAVFIKMKNDGKSFDEIGNYFGISSRNAEYLYENFSGTGQQRKPYKKSFTKKYKRCIYPEIKKYLIEKKIDCWDLPKMTGYGSYYKWRKC